MKMHLTKFEKVILGILFILGISCYQLLHSLSNYWDDIIGLWGGAICGAFATLIVLHFNRKEEEKKWKKELGNYSTTLTRIKQGEKGKPLSIPRSSISLKYVGSRKFIGVAEYKDGDAQFEITFERENLSIGSGVFQYITGIDHTGTYKVQRDFINENLIHIYYENIIPDNQVTGYETWSSED